MSKVQPLVVHGADLSHHNANPNLRLAKSNGLKFLYHKATEGLTVKDHMYLPRRRVAEDAGVPFGAYHFARPSGNDAKAEAQFFFETASPKAGDLAPALDFEVQYPNAKQWCIEFMEELERLLKKAKLQGRPIHYGPDDFGPDYKYLRWVPRYNDDNVQPRVKWDIWQFSDGALGKPNSHPGLGHVDLNFMRAGVRVKDFKLTSKIADPKRRDTEVLKFAHASMQFSDTSKRKDHDIEVVFSRGYHIITGTEAGQKDMQDALKAAARKHGYRLHIWRSVWIAVSKSIIDGDWRKGAEPVLESNEGVGEHADRGVVWVKFDNEKFGPIAVAAGHYLTNGRPGQPNHRLNLEYAETIGKWFEKEGKGAAIAFYGGDQNVPDRLYDTFFGKAEATSSWDELGKWQNTGHGNIDIIASYDRDGRVKAKKVRALNDKKLFLHTDHFLVEANMEVKLLK